MITLETATADVLTPNFATQPKGRARRRRQASHVDADLIDLCIEYGMQIAAGRAAYEIDPTDSDFAHIADNIAQARAGRAMTAILEREPLTIDGVRAKAAIVKLAIEDWSGDLDDLRQNFIISLADDVVRLQRHARGLKCNQEIIVVPA